MARIGPRTPPSRIRRLWALVEDIAQHPGMQRRDLAQRYHISERQAQADLNIIRCDMRLPLVRCQGYRFATEGRESAPGGFTLHEASLLLTLLANAKRDLSIPLDALKALVDKLPTMFPPHLQPIVGQTLREIDAAPTGRRRVMVALLNAILQGSWVEIGWASSVTAATLQPELLLPFGGRWYVLGLAFKPERTLVWPLADAVSVSTVLIQTETKEIKRIVKVAS